MSFYQNYKKNYWERKVLNKKNNFDLRLLKENKTPISQDDQKKLFKNYCCPRSAPL